jgi:hypothetical protein
VRLAPLAVLLLAGCPSTYGFRVQVVSEQAPLEAIHVGEGGLVADQLVPVAGAQITCEGCRNKPAPVGGEGRFGIDAGTQYAAPKKLVLHVTAPDHEPIDVAFATAPIVSQLGPGTLVVVMKRRAPPD